MLDLRTHDMINFQEDLVKSNKMPGWVTNICYLDKKFYTFGKEANGIRHIPLQQGSRKLYLNFFNLPLTSKWISKRTFIKDPKHIIMWEFPNYVFSIFKIVGMTRKFFFV